MKNIFTEHPNSINETYLEHMKNALLIGLKLIKLFLYSLIHSIFPFLFINDVSNEINTLNKGMQKRQRKNLKPSSPSNTRKTH